MKTLKQLTTDDRGAFTWLWSEEYFIQSHGKGNWIWKSSEYAGGDNTIRRYNGTLTDYLKEIQLPFGRGKGVHTIKQYCGDQVKILE